MSKNNTRISLPESLVRKLRQYFDREDCPYCGGWTGHCVGCPGGELLEALAKRTSRIAARRATIEKSLAPHPLVNSDETC